MKIDGMSEQEMIEGANECAVQIYKVCLELNSNWPADVVVAGMVTVLVSQSLAQPDPEHSITSIAEGIRKTFDEYRKEAMQ